MRLRITKSFTFDAAHMLPNVPDGHPCGRMHGHTYSVELVLWGDVVEPAGWVQDYGDVSAVWRRTGGKLDHTCLNTTLDNPTAEHLCIYLATELLDELPLLAAITVRETATSSATIFVGGTTK